jgi:hypothetical protein
MNENSLELPSECAIRQASERDIKSIRMLVWSFREAAWQELPQSLKFKFGLSQLAKTLFKIPVTIMQYQAGFL